MDLHRRFPSQRSAATWLLETQPDSVTVRIPILAEDDSETGALVLQYLRDDPLVTQLQVCAPSGGLVLERSILRSDLREALTRTRCNPTLTVGPDGPGCVRASLHEGAASVHLVIPSEAVVLLLRGADALVHPSREAEEIDRLIEVAFAGPRPGRKAVA